MDNDELKLRWQVLTMAKELALKEYYESLEEIKINWVCGSTSTTTGARQTTLSQAWSSFLREKNRKRDDLYPIRSGTAPDISFPDFPTTKDILEKASSLYTFMTTGSVQGGE